MILNPIWLFFFQDPFDRLDCWWPFNRILSSATSNSRSPVNRLWAECSSRWMGVSVGQVRHSPPSLIQCDSADRYNIIWNFKNKICSGLNGPANYMSYIFTLSPHWTIASKGMRSNKKAHLDFKDWPEIHRKPEDFIIF